MVKYRHLEIEESVGEPTAAEMEAIEKKLGVKMPESFVDFLKVANGAYLPYSVDVLLDENGKTEALSFCELYRTRGSNHSQGADESTFIAEIDAERKYRNAPPEVLPFARDGGSSIIYLDLTAKGAGRVIAFIEGLPSWTESNPNDTFIEIAKSFDEFVDKLYRDPDL